jgi:transposase
MPRDMSKGKPITRRYSEEATAVRMARALRTELGTEHGTIGRVATRLGREQTRCGCGV